MKLDNKTKKKYEIIGVIYVFMYFLLMCFAIFVQSPLRDVAIALGICSFIGSLYGDYMTK